VGQRAKNRGSEALQAFTEKAHRTGLEYFTVWYATDPDRQLRTIDQLVAERGARAGRGVAGTRARACDRTDAGGSAPTRASGVRYRTRPAAGGTRRAERARRI